MRTQVGHMQLRKVIHNVIKEVGKTIQFVINEVGNTYVSIRTWKLNYTGRLASNPVIRESVVT